MEVEEVSEKSLRNGQDKAIQDPDVVETRFWKIAPGERACLWQDCLKGNLICVGWDELGDMRSQQDKATFDAIFSEFYGIERLAEAGQLWDFANVIRQGDTVVANNGVDSIVGVGTVTGAYWYDGGRRECKHCISVRWEIASEFPIPEAAREVVKDWLGRTVKGISRDEYNDITVAEWCQIVWGPRPSTPPPRWRSGRLCAVCGAEMAVEKRTLTGREIREYSCPKCGHSEIEDCGEALWQIVHKTQEQKPSAATPRLDRPMAPSVWDRLWKRSRRNS